MFYTSPARFLAACAPQMLTRHSTSSKPLRILSFWQIRPHPSQILPKVGGIVKSYAPRERERASARQRGNVVSEESVALPASPPPTPHSLLILRYSTSAAHNQSSVPRHNRLSWPSPLCSMARLETKGGGCRRVEAPLASTRFLPPETKRGGAGG